MASKIRSIGGQAVMEGVMMRSPEKMAIAVRQENGRIVMRRDPVPQRTGVAKWPFVRGVVNFVFMLKSGMKTLNDSMEMLGIEEEPTKFEIWLSKKTGKSVTDMVMGLGIVLGVALALGLFIVLPNLAASLLSRWIETPILVNLSEGVVRILIFTGYLVAITAMNDIKRFFAYHGAEHKTVNCFEAGQKLTVENIQKQSTQNPRCGTSFLFIVVIISILVFTLTGWRGAWWGRILIRLALLPVVASISYEVLMALARHNNVCTRVLRWPGMQFQRLTTRQPDDSMVEVARAAFVAVLNEEERAAAAPEGYRVPDEAAEEAQEGQA